MMRYIMIRNGDDKGDNDKEVDDDKDNVATLCGQDYVR